LESLAVGSDMSPQETIKAVTGRAYSTAL
jgi:hypothetical protein